MIVRGDSLVWVPANLRASSIPLIINDPPYGKIVKAEWDGSWTMRQQWEMTAVIRDVLVDGGTAYVWGGIGKYRNRIFFEWLANLERQYSDLQLWDMITWSKRRAYGTDRRYLFTREECAMIVKGSEPRTFNIPLLDEKRGYPGMNPKYPAKSEYKRRTNVWTDVSELFSGKIHDCEKPSRLAEIMIETSSNPGETVVDMFAGSGSTGVAASKMKRKCILIEKRVECAMHSIPELR